jgi:hypothetical protein
VATVVNSIQTSGLWQGNACSVSLVPAYAASFDATGVSFTDAVRIDATVAGLGQPKAMATAERTHKSITRPGSPPRGRLR